MNYPLLNGAVLLSVLFIAVLVERHYAARRGSNKPLLITMAIVLGLTAVFDTLIIAAGIVAYNSEHILGIYIGRAPIEDFAYAVVSVILVVLLWEYYDRQN